MRELSGQTPSIAPGHDQVVSKPRTLIRGVQAVSPGTQPKSWGTEANLLQARRTLVLPLCLKLKRYVGRLISN